MVYLFYYLYFQVYIAINNINFIILILQYPYNLVRRQVGSADHFEERSRKNVQEIKIVQSYLDFNLLINAHHQRSVQKEAYDDEHGR